MTPSLKQPEFAEPRPAGSWITTELVAEGALLLLMLSAAFLLGCQQLSDADFWWHLRSGQFILEQRKIPTVDPFTFASADRPWVDLSWLFQVTLAVAFAAGGVPGAIVMTAAVCAAAIAVVLILRDRRAPSWLAAVCWLPALALMSARFVPRPEIFSVVGMALYLTILLKADSTPALAWLLPGIQVLWVNTHGLFVLGPIILVAYLADRVARSVQGIGEPDRKQWWVHLGGASVLVVIACLVNPYGLRGALFPLELFPKITAWGGLYKSYIIEFGDLRDLVRKSPASAGSLYLRIECFLLWLMPAGFIVPAVWRCSRPVARQNAMHVGAFAAALALIAVSVLGFPAPGTPTPILWLGRMAAPAMIVLTILGAGLLFRTSRRAANLAFTGGLATALSMIWLRWHLFGQEPGPAAWLAGLNVGAHFLGWATALLMLATAWLVLRAGGRLFILMIAMIFGYLALQAIRNMNLLGLASGIVLTWNLGGWARDMASTDGNTSRQGPSPVLARLAASALVAALIGFVIFTILTGRFFRATSEPRQLGLRESPLAFAHQAAQFAGQAAMPDRAIAYDLSQAGVFIFHNGPGRKVFMDGRLEVPDRDTFETYVRLENMLNEGRRSWAEPVRRLGEPLVLLGHAKEFGAEATLLVDPGWRCIYFDAIASIFVANSRTELNASFPSVDFAARHFHDQKWRALPPQPHGIAEGQALLNLASALEYREGLSGKLPISIVLAAGHRFRQAIALDRESAANWTLLGMCCWDMIADLKVAPPGPAEPWDIARGILPAQASACFRRALELDPGDQVALSSFLRSLEARGMRDPARALFELHDLTSDNTNAPSRAGQENNTAREGLGQRVAGLLDEGRFEAVLPCFVNAERRGITPDWATSDRVATTLLHLGRNADARRVWERAAAPPSQAVRLSRIATAALASQEFAAAKEGFEAALKLDSGLGEAWFGLALLHVQLGEADEAAAACEAGLRRPGTAAQAASLKLFMELR
jgi:tetratricopeptide (TPR) repeat protein